MSHWRGFFRRFVAWSGVSQSSAASVDTPRTAVHGIGADGARADDRAAHEHERPAVVGRKSCGPAGVLPEVIKADLHGRDARDGGRHQYLTVADRGAPLVRSTTDAGVGRPWLAISPIGRPAEGVGNLA
jgi:hypothetical protein